MHAFEASQSQSYKPIWWLTFWPCNLIIMLLTINWGGRVAIFIPNTATHLNPAQSARRWHFCGIEYTLSDLPVLVICPHVRSYYKARLAYILRLFITLILVIEFYVESICIRREGDVLALSMLRLPLSKAQGYKDFRKPSKPGHINIHWKALAEYYHMSVSHFPVYFTSFCNGQISHQQQKG